MRKEYSGSQSLFRIILAFIILTCFDDSLKGQFYLPCSLQQKLSGLKRENKFDEALSLLDLQIDTLKYKHDQKPVIEAKLLKADLYRMKGSIDKSAVLMDSLLTQCKIILPANDPLFAELYTIQGTLLLTKGELTKGHIVVQKAVEIYLKAFGKEDTLLAPCYNKLGNYYYFNKSYDSAMVYYSKALELANKKSNNLEDRASYVQNIGIIHLEMNDYSKAESCFLESLHLKESIYSPNSFSLGRIYLNLARFYQGISALDKSLFYIEKAEKIYSIERLPAHFELGKTYWNKGIIYYFLGDFELAITYLLNARQIISSVFFENKQLLSSLNSDIGNVYMTQEQNDKAILFYHLSLSGADTLLKIKTIRNIAKLYLLEGDLKKAKDYFDTLFSVTRGTINKKNPENALTFLHYGNYLLKKGNDSALIYLNKAFGIFNENKGFHDRDLAAALYGIGDYFYNKDRVEQALNYYQKSLISISSSYSDTNILNNPPLESLSSDVRIIRILSKKAYYLNELFYKNGDITYLISAIQTCLLSLNLVDQIRMSYRAENSQMMLSKDIYLIYKQAIDNCLMAYSHSKDSEWLNQAFELSERTKSMVLLNELKDANAKKIGLIPEELRKQEKEIKSNLNVYNNNILEEENESEPDYKKLDYLRSRQLIYEKKYDSLVDQLEENYPEYYKLKYDPSVVSVKELQHVIEDNEIVVEYTLSKDCLYTFIISENEFDVKKTPIDSNLIKDIFALRENLDFSHVPDYNYLDYMNYQRIAHNLYTVLIQPVASYLEDKKVIIIPDEELSYLSFEALIEEITPSDTIEFRRLHYLIKKCPVSYAASSTILYFVKKRRMPVLNSGVLALAPSTNIFTRSFLANNKALAQQLKSSQDLPGATWEAEAILKMMKGKKLIGEEATEAEFKKLASSYDILHFATHTRIDDENPLSSVLSFYPYGGEGEDGALHTYEIYNLELKGELAVLSACSTGNGKLQKGEGVISLARAFTYAGMPSVIMTLWDVEDISSGNIIPSFYYLLGKGFDKDIALRQAKLNYLVKTKPEIETHPAFWSGYVLYGNNRGFRQSRDEFFLILLFVLGGLIILVSFVLMRRYINFRKNLRRVDIDLPIEFRAEDGL
jgi:CHAT domain-containing protein/tetratricopeptide (TPR) repeat protein